MRVALYARVSTQDQDCERQLRDLRQFAQRRDDQTVSYTHLTLPIYSV